jgi:hypothetical protein
MYKFWTDAVIQIEAPVPSSKEEKPFRTEAVGLEAFSQEYAFQTFRMSLERDLLQEKVIYCERAVEGTENLPFVRIAGVVEDVLAPFGTKTLVRASGKCFAANFAPL